MTDKEYLAAAAYAAAEQLADNAALRAAYNHADYLAERRKMMQVWANYLTELKKKAKQESVSPSVAQNRDSIIEDSY
jgi:hypothetical protein